MFDIADLPITPAESRAARGYLTLSQAKVAEESGLRVDKLKRFEAEFGRAGGGYIPDGQYLADLRAFYEDKGYRFDTKSQPAAKAKAAGKMFPAGVVGDDPADPAPTGPRSARGQAEVHHMRIALKGDDIDAALSVIEQNEDRIDTLLQQPVKEGFFGGFSESAQVTHAEVLKLLAENGRLYARLFGRQIGGEPAPEVIDGSKAPKTHAELLHRRQAEAHKAATGDREAMRRKQAEKPADSLLSALFG